ncbi:plasma membrane-associated cation-binding protein 1 [Gastrolobium bilobum]|uniref:plasma membrane-associated cation-binding protein 1 n=1 Tax=Gastrolobium bilobum TaxID=150636 RepID=UPI002AB1F975|nr:plasma membrane-associated cation-binding protein 1 [Gastrolobium bilobum]
MGYWKSKVLPKIKKVFEKNSTKKSAAAAEISKSFDESKEEYNKAFEEKKTELQTKVLEIYEASSTEVKGLVKEPNEAGLKKNSTAVHKFLEELVKIDFPGSKAASEASSKFGPALVSGPVFFVFEKLSTLIVVEEKEEVKVEAPPTATKTEEEDETSTVKEREIVVEEEKKDEEKPQVVETTEKIESEAPAEAKVEEQPAELEPAAKEEEKHAETVAVEQAEPSKP